MDKKTVLVDFDGVLNSYVNGWQGENKIPDDPPNAGAIEWLKELVKHFEVYIFSTRCSSMVGREIIALWLNRNGFTYEMMNKYKLKMTHEKVPAIVTIDDRAIQFNGTFPTIQQIDEFKPYKPTTT